MSNVLSHHTPQAILLGLEGMQMTVLGSKSALLMPAFLRRVPHRLRSGNY